jgi:lantibiotic transport system permease protein
MNLTTAFTTELLKSKRTACWYLSILAAMAIPLVFVIDVSIDGVSPDNRANPLAALYIEGFKGLNVMILPLFVILVNTLLPQVEYRSNTWKQLLSSPQPLSQLYLSKFLMINLLVLLFLTSFISSTGLGSFLIDHIDPSLHLFSYSLDWKIIAGYTAKSYLSVLPIIVVQFILGLRFRNFIAPIAIGLALWATGILFVFNSHSSLANCFPYSYTIMIMFPVFEKSLGWIEWMSVIYSVVTLIAGYQLIKSYRFK